MIKVGNNTVVPAGIKKVTYSNNIVYEKIKPLCFTAVGSTSSISYEIINGGLDIDLQYSKDKKNWQHWDQGYSIALENGESVYIQNKKDTLSTGAGGYVHFLMPTGYIAASGNILSLINYNQLVSEDATGEASKHRGCFKGLFYQCTALVTAPQLPPPKKWPSLLPKYCYQAMFEYCGNLQVIKEDDKIDSDKLFFTMSDVYNEAVTSMFSNTCYGTVEVETEKKYYYRWPHRKHEDVTFIATWPVGSKFFTGQTTVDHTVEDAELLDDGGLGGAITWGTKTIKYSCNMRAVPFEEQTQEIKVRYYYYY